MKRLVTGFHSYEGVTSNTESPQALLAQRSILSRAINPTFRCLKKKMLSWLLNYVRRRILVLSESWIETDANDGTYNQSSLLAHCVRLQGI